MIALQDAKPPLEPSLLERALADHRASRFSQAEAAYREFLSLHPENTDALHMLGLLLFQCDQTLAGLGLLNTALVIDPAKAACHGHRGLMLAAIHRTSDAISAYQTALALNPRLADVHNNLGNLLLTVGNAQDAISAYRAAIHAQPDLIEAHTNLGLALMRLPDYAQAIVALHQAASLRPQDQAIAAHLATAYSNHGTTLETSGHVREAIAAFTQSITLNPASPEARFNLGKCLAASGQFEAAIPEYLRALALKPDFPQAHNNLGIALSARGNLPEALAAYHEALRLDPNSSSALNNLADALRTVGRINDAIDAYHRALRLAPDDPELWSNLGSALDLRGDLAEALAAFQKATTLRPAFAQARNNMANTLKNLGQVEAALTAYQQALAFDPSNQEIHSNRLYTLYFHPNASLEKIHREHHQWNTAHAARYRPAAPISFADRSPHRKLRIGYVAATFRDHCQSFFTVPLFSHHDHQHFEIIAYSDTASSDAITARLQNCCDAWHNTAGLSDDALAGLIRQHHIDILVDLSLHMSHNRLMLFARKPAPIQVTWLGYPGTTGLDTIDYRLTDPHLDPPPPMGNNDAFYSEKSWRLPHTFWCYDPLTAEPPVNPLPASANGHITFGCLNNFCKVNEAVLHLWSAVLRNVSNSHLLLLAPRAAQPRLLETFQAQGIQPHRIAFVERSSRARYLACYHRIDIGLDTFPYNGHTTSLDSLWMGVPVVTLVSDAPAGRAGWSQLYNLNLTQLAATSEHEFIRTAVALAENTANLARLRASLRERLAHSPLTDGAQFARDVEHAYRTFFHHALAT
jgi:protein O-GlcNAc transferase